MKLLMPTLLLACAVSAPPLSVAEPAELVLSPAGTHTLQVPVVGFRDNPGRYQNARFQSSDAGGSWTLLSADVAGLINFVELDSVVVTRDVPLQVFVKVKGWESPCGTVGRFETVKEGTLLKGFLYTDPASYGPPGSACIDSVNFYTRTLPLPVYGLAAGQYQFTVNGKVSGSFTLPVDNVLP